MLGSGRKRLPDAKEMAQEESEDEHPEPEDGAEATSEDGNVEDWVAWIKRTTQTAEVHMQRAQVEDWIQGQKRRKWRLAGRTAQANDQRWSQRVLEWEIDASCRGRGRPKIRWEDEIAAFVAKSKDVEKGRWIEVACQTNVWQQLEHEYVNA